MLVLNIVFILAIFPLSSYSAKTSMQRALEFLARHPVVDTHNDLAWSIRKIIYNDLRLVDLKSDLSTNPEWKSSNMSHTDIPRLRKGRVGGQFWSAYVECPSQYLDAVETTLETIDVIKRFSRQYSDDFEFVTTADGIEKAMKNGKIASLIGVEGGHSIQFSFGILRMLYELGTRYLTLTHNCNTPWADSHFAEIKEDGFTEDNNGLSAFGVGVIKEMNRLGMIVDLSHVSTAVAFDALKYSRAPVIFSHSGPLRFCNSSRNVPDALLRILKANGGMLGLSFVAEARRCNGTEIVDLNDIVTDLEYLKCKLGADHIGLGADYDGVEEHELPVDLPDVSYYPHIFAALIERGWTDNELEKLANKNIIRVLRQVEKVSAHLKAEVPQQGTVPLSEAQRRSNLSTLYFYPQHQPRNEREFTKATAHATYNRDALMDDDEHLC